MPHLFVIVKYQGVFCWVQYNQCKHRYRPIYVIFLIIKLLSDKYRMTEPFVDISIDFMKLIHLIVLADIFAWFFFSFLGNNCLNKETKFDRNWSMFSICFWLVKIYCGVGKREWHMEGYVDIIFFLPSVICFPFLALF